MTGMRVVSLLGGVALLKIENGWHAHVAPAA